MAASPRLRRSVFTLIYWLLFIISTLTYPWAPIAELKSQKKQKVRIEAAPQACYVVFSLRLQLSKD